ncbi:MAG: putative toxin-antitoxin system toxin component, PIN family [Limnohabitans sp.]
MTSFETQAKPGAQAWVIDTNIVLDLWLFEDPATIPLRAALQSGAISHLATDSMRDELERVLAYPHLVKRMAKSNIQAQDILNRFDEHLLAVEPAAKALFTCKDPDDQKFIDLAVAHAVPLLSKDKAILCMKKRLLQSGVVLNPTDISAH